MFLPIVTPHPMHVIMSQCQATSYTKHMLRKKLSHVVRLKKPGCCWSLWVKWSNATTVNDQKSTTIKPSSTKRAPIVLSQIEHWLMYGKLLWLTYSESLNKAETKQLVEV